MEQGLSLIQHWALWDPDALTSMVRQKGKNWHQEPRNNKKKKTLWRVNVALSFLTFPAILVQTARHLQEYFSSPVPIIIFTPIPQGPEGYVPAHSIKGVIWCQDISQAHQPAQLYHPNASPSSPPISHIPASSQRSHSRSPGTMLCSQRPVFFFGGHHKGNSSSK